MAAALPPHVDVQTEHALPLNLFNIPRHYATDVDSVLVPHGLVLDRVARLAQDIMKDTTGPLVCICVLKGGHQFFADLVNYIKRSNVERERPVQLSLEFIRVKSYVNDQSTGEVQVAGMDGASIKGKHVLIVEDIVDTGKSAVAVTEELKKFQPASIRFATLLIKKTPHRNSFRPDYIGFAIPDAFVVGYALDYNEYYRDLDHICVISESGKVKYAQQ